MEDSHLIELHGCIQARGRDFTQEEAQTLVDDFLSWLTERGAGFGGGITFPHPDD